MNVSKDSKASLKRISFGNKKVIDHQDFGLPEVKIEVSESLGSK